MLQLSVSCSIVPLYLCNHRSLILPSARALFRNFNHVYVYNYVTEHHWSKRTTSAAWTASSFYKPLVRSFVRFIAACPKDGKNSCPIGFRVSGDGASRGGPGTNGWLWAVQREYVWERDGAARLLSRYNSGRPVRLLQAVRPRVRWNVRRCIRISGNMRVRSRMYGEQVSISEGCQH